jgi:single-strand DNA-binding protein
MINRVVLVGRITRDPEIQQTNGGVSYVRFSIAVDRPFKNQNGDKLTDFINCIAWRSQADFLKNFVKKGNMIGVDGRIQVTSYQDGQGANRQSFDIFVENVANLEPKKNDNQFQPSDAGFAPVAGYANNSNNAKSQNETEEPVMDYDVSEDDLPF